MKKIFSILAAFTVMAFAGCNNGGDGNKEIELPDQTEKTQQAYADDETSGGFTFTAKSSWEAIVKENTRVSEVSWLRLTLGGVETYSGGAGTFTLAIELDPNYSGVDRKATIVIKCGNDTITITVEQKGKTEQGEIPTDPDPELPSDKYERFVSRMEVVDDGKSSGYFTFEYDSDGRVIKLSEYWGDGDTDESSISYPNENTIIISTEGEDAPGTYTITLNSDGYATAYIHSRHESESINSFIYNNGYLTRYTYSDGEGYGKYTWQTGNLVKVEYPDGTHTYTYTSYPNNDKVNLDLNGYLMGEASWGLSLFGWVGKRSANYVSTGWLPLSRDSRDGEVGEGYYTTWEDTYEPLVWAFDADGYVETITCSYTEKYIKVTGGVREVLRTINHTEVLRITYK